MEPVQIQKSEWEFSINTALVLVLAAAAVLVYSGTFEVPFLFDDYTSILDERAEIQIEKLNPEQLKQVVTESHGRHRPLSMISLAINYYFGKTDVFGYHVVNLAIHILTACFLFFLFQTTLRLSAANKPEPLVAGAAAEQVPKDPKVLYPTWIAFFAVLLWTIHPVQTNAVTYIVQRMTSLAAMFYILSLFLYAKGRIALREDRRYPAFGLLAGCLIAALCAFASKEIAATLPFFILLYEWYFFQNLSSIVSKRFAAGGVLALLLLLLIVYFFLGANPVDRILSTYGTWDFTLPQRVLTEFRVLAYYFSLLFFPHPDRLVLDYNFPLSHALWDPPTTILSIVMVLMLFAAAVYGAKRHRLFSFCILWFLGTLVIESSVVAIEIIYEHRLYLPSVMVFLLAVYLAWEGIRYKKAVAAGLVILACVFSMWTYQRNQVWTNDVTFWQDCAAKSPRDARPYQNLAYSLQLKGYHRQAARFYRKSFQFQINTAAFFKLGYCCGKTGRHLEAIEAYKNAIEYGYRSPAVYSSLAREQILVGEYNAALENFDQALEVDSGFEEARHNKKMLSKFLEGCSGQIDCIKKLCRAYPRNPALRFKLGTLYEAENNMETAVTYHEKALSMTREKDRRLYRLAVMRLADCRMRTGEADKALSLLKEAAGIWTKDPELCYRLAALHARQANSEKALKWLKKAVRQGFSDAKRLESDPRFHSLRGLEGFREVQESLAASNTEKDHPS